MGHYWSTVPAVPADQSTYSKVNLNNNKTI